MRPGGGKVLGSAADRWTWVPGGSYGLPMPMRFPRPVAICAVGLLLAAAGAAPAVGAARVAGWRIEPPRSFRRLHLRARKMEPWDVEEATSRRSCGTGLCGWSEVRPEYPSDWPAIV